MSGSAKRGPVRPETGLKSAQPLSHNTEADKTECAERRIIGPAARHLTEAPVGIRALQ
jgi:hypothetical protein